MRSLSLIVIAAGVLLVLGGVGTAEHSDPHRSDSRLRSDDRPQSAAMWLMIGGASAVAAGVFLKVTAGKP